MVDVLRGTVCGADVRATVTLSRSTSDRHEQQIYERSSQNADIRVTVTLGRYTSDRYYTSDSYVEQMYWSNRVKDKGRKWKGVWPLRTHLGSFDPLCLRHSSGSFAKDIM
jgi:hypothetical protein